MVQLAWLRPVVVDVLAPGHRYSGVASPVLGNLELPLVCVEVGVPACLCFLLSFLACSRPLSCPHLSPCSYPPFLGVPPPCCFCPSACCAPLRVASRGLPRGVLSSAVCLALVCCLSCVLCLGRLSQVVLGFQEQPDMTHQRQTHTQPQLFLLAGSKVTFEPACCPLQDPVQDPGCLRAGPTKRAEGHSCK